MNYCTKNGMFLDIKRSVLYTYKKAQCFLNENLIDTLYNIAVENIVLCFT